MKRIVPECAFAEEKLNKISCLAEKMGLTEQIVRILFARGIDTEEAIRVFMHPSKNNFLSPFLMQGMKEAVEMIEDARTQGKTVVIFGDYDADGICASAIMYYALRDYGIQPYVYIPERADGYGLSIEMIDRIFEECNPDLFITVDCGISNAKEAQYIYELGADIIITDHHELPEVLPDCVVVNPKIKDDYPYDNLCGAGVAFKVACALIGERAYDYLDFATLATVADSVPLLGENRDIVTEGLKRFNTNIRPCFAGLIGKTYDTITAQSLAFTIAPRVNAAGRMGDAYTAFLLFISNNAKEIYDLTVKLCAYNTERQKYCDELYLCAKQKLKQKGAFGKVIMLCDESWNAGFIGIVAARIADEYKRPTLLFVRNGNMLKGSARSIDSINIFSVLKNCSQFIEEFGGHSQAAGVNVRVENFEALEQALNDEISKCYDQTDFEERILVSQEVTTRFPEKLARELVTLEPYGVGHRKPLFSIPLNTCETRVLKSGSPHLAIKSDYIDLTYFSGVKHLKILQSDVHKKIIFEVNISKFKGREYVKGIVRNLLYDGRTGDYTAERIFANAVSRTKLNQVPVNITKLNTKEIQNLILQKKEDCAYGLCLIAEDRKTLQYYPMLKDLNCDLFYPTTRDVSNTLLLSPAVDAELSGYRDIVFLDTPADYNILSIAGRQVFVNGEICGYKTFENLSVSRERLLEIFSALRREVNGLQGATPEEVAYDCDGLGFGQADLIFALNVFEELGLISFDDDKLTVYRGIKTELNDSAIYRKICKLQQNESERM